jgi:hypothetical protein
MCIGYSWTGLSAVHKTNVRGFKEYVRAVFMILLHENWYRIITAILTRNKHNTMLKCISTFKGKHNYVAEIFHALYYQLAIANIKKWEWGKHFQAYSPVRLQYTDLLEIELVFYRVCTLELGTYM